MASREQFVAITSPEDAEFGHVPLVAEHMDGRLTVVDLVPGVIAGNGLSYAVDDSGLRCEYDGQVLDHVVSVWDRRPTPPTQGMFAGVNPDYRRYAYDSVRRLAREIYVQFPDALWVSDRFAVQRAELKSVQLAEAKKMGFRVPDTLITSDPVAARRFVGRHAATIVKGLGAEGVNLDDGTLLLLYSAVITPETDLDYDSLNFGPVIFQQAIEPDHDLRITVVGDEVFTAAITADAERDIKIGVRDWRIGNHNGQLNINASDIPEDIKDKCRSLVKVLGLKFGAIDMVVDKQGRHWFLEINPAGQWAFVEDATSQPIGKAMARLLLSGASDR